MGVEPINPAEVRLNRPLKALAKKYKVKSLGDIPPRRVRKLEELIAV